MGLFDKRVNLRPVEYPEFLKYRDAIRQSYWVHTEFNMSEDVQDIHTKVSDSEREAILKTMLAIAQIEVAVKTFWGDIYHRMPKPEIGAVGFTFAESEVRHQDAYAFLVEHLGLNEMFEEVTELPAIKDRIEYLDQFLSGKDGDDKDYAMAILMFSIFIEHISLFSQFLIMMSFNRDRAILKGISNVVEATSKEEQLHGRFGALLINILREEYPDWFDDEYKEKVREACIKAYKAENKILDWIFEDGELDFLPKETIRHFLMDRFNTAMTDIDLEPVFETDPEEVAKTLWFEEEILVTKQYDFFAKRPTNYTKKTESITKDDLF